MLQADGYWTYTCRCEACLEPIDYCVPKRTTDPVDGYNHTAFAAYVGMMRPTWSDCERCGRMTLQTPIAYERAKP